MVKKKIRWERMFKATNTGETNKTSYWWIAAAILVLFFGWEYFVKLFKGKKKRVISKIIKLINPSLEN